MNLYKKFVIALVSIIIGISGTALVHAEVSGTGTATDTGPVFSRLKEAGKNSTLGGGPGSGSATLLFLIGEFMKTALGFLGVVGLILVIYAGYLWFTAGGSEDNVEKAKTLLKNAVIGLIIISLAYTITAYVVGKVICSTSSGSSAAECVNF